MPQRNFTPSAYGWTAGLAGALFVVVVGGYLLLTWRQPNPYPSASDTRFQVARVGVGLVGAVVVVAAGCLVTAALQAIGTSWGPRTQAAVSVGTVAALLVTAAWLATRL